MNLIPFRLQLDTESNIIIEFIYRATKKGYYQVKLTYEPMTEKVIKTTCECWDYRMKSSKDENYQCKHIKNSMIIIQDHKQELNKGELP